MTAPAVLDEAPSPARRRRRRSAWAWIAIAAVLLLAGAAGAALSTASDWSQKGLLDPDSAGPAGTRALAQILREHGVEVDVLRSLDAAKGALSADATLVLPSTAVLSDGALRDLAERAGDVVLVDPSGRDVRVLLDGAETAGFAPGDLVAPQCDQPDAARSGAIAPGTLYTTGDAGALGCYPVDDGYGLVAVERSASARTVAVDARELFTNAALADDGNAALAIGLTGRHPVVVWYMPSLLDGDAGTATPSIGDLTPPWVTPAISLLAVAAVVAAVWRGRRFGPLVAENLPVTVRASETMEGRARLYARSRDAAHALDALRLGARGRIARLLGLAPTSSAGDVADAAADRVGAPRDVVRGILVDSAPATDAELVAASDRLRDLEAAVRAAVRPT